MCTAVLRMWRVNQTSQVEGQSQSSSRQVEKKNKKKKQCIFQQCIHRCSYNISHNNYATERQLQCLLPNNYFDMIYQSNII